MRMEITIFWLVTPFDAVKERAFYIFRVHSFILASNRNEYQENFLGVNAAGA
jgi:hypothetical protein